MSAPYRRMAARRGKKRALVAVGHTVLGIASHMRKRGQPYRDLGAMYCDKVEHHRVEKRLVHRLERLGYQVILPPSVMTG